MTYAWNAGKKICKSYVLNLMLPFHIEILHTNDHRFVTMPRPTMGLIFIPADM